jgi:hypothetical protein
VILTEGQLRRLVQILGMLGSQHDGEVLNAAHAAQHLLGSVGVTWEELLSDGGTPGARWSDDDLCASINEAYKKGYAAALGDREREALKAFADADTCPAFAKLCLTNYKELLTDWEIGFCESWSIKSDRITPTERQCMIFRRLARKVNLTLPEMA